MQHDIEAIKKKKKKETAANSVIAKQLSMAGSGVAYSQFFEIQYNEIL